MLQSQISPTTTCRPPDDFLTVCVYLVPGFFLTVLVLTECVGCPSKRASCPELSPTVPQAFRDMPPKHGEDVTAPGRRGWTKLG